MKTAVNIMPEQKKRLYLIDGYGFVFRAYHALSKQNLTRADGTPVGAVFAFTNMLMKLQNDHVADYMAVIFDAGSKTFRNDMYKEYKANRPPAPEDLIPQFPLVREAAIALGLPAVEMKGYEADDIIATYTKQARMLGHEVVIISSDKDLMQLVGDGVEMFDAMKSRSIGIEQVVEKFGVTPDKVLDVLALMGDSSDNVPGVPGIGPKTAAELINQFGSLDDVLNRAGEVKQNKRRESLIENREKALLSRDLVRLCDEVPLELSVEDFAVKELDNEILLAFAREQNFKALINKIEGKVAAKPAVVAVKAASENILIDDIKNIKQWIDKSKEVEFLSFLPEYGKNNSLSGVSISLSDKRSCYVALNNNQPQQTNLFGETEGEGDALSLDSILKEIKNILEDRSVMKIGYDIKELVKATKTNGININPIEDVMLLSYTLEAGMHNHAFEHLIARNIDEEITFPSAKEMAELPAEKHMDYACLKSSSLIKLYEILRRQLFDEKANTIYEKLERALVEVLADMELAGIKADAGKLRELSADMAKKIAILEKEIYALAACEFNIGSPKQLGEILFEKLNLPSGKKSKKTGAYSTDVKVLQELADSGIEIAEKILSWRHLSKIKSTYADSLPKEIGKDGRIHTHFAMAATNTGRLSSHDPNLQNIPVRSEEGNKIREAFIAEKGHKLISADYSQIELRLLAHIADIGSLKDAFAKGQDIHAATASQMFGMAVDQVDSESRRKAKMINFGIIYGISAFGLAQRLGIGRNEAGEYIKQYFRQYPGIENYMRETVEFARKHGYVQTIWGRKCHITGIADKNPAMRQFSERAAINAPLQGSAADIIKKAMVILDSELHKKGLKARALLQVHDELVLEAPDAEAEEVSRLVKHVMENVVQLSVPVTVDVGVGENWMVV